MKESNSTQTLTAASIVCSLLPQIAGLVAGIAALAYFAGWKVASAYYAELGAPWALSLLSSAQIMQQSILLITIVGITGLVSLIQLLNQSSSPDSFRRWAIYMMLGAVLLSGGGLLFKQRLNPLVVYATSILSGLLWAFSAGLTIGELIGRLAEEDLRWDSRHFFLVYFVYLCGLVAAPDYIGRARAELDGNPKTSKLPIVQLAQSHTDARWQLVTVFSGQTLLMLTSDKPEETKFKLLTNSDLQVVSVRSK